MKEYGVADSWEKLFIINIKEHGRKNYPKLRHNGELLLAKFCYEARKTELVSYDCDNNKVKNLGVHANATIVGLLFTVHTYLDSLVLIKGSNEVKIVEESDQDSLEYTRIL